MSFITSWQDFLHLFDKLIVLLGYETYIDIASDMEINSKIGITRILNLLVVCIIVLNSKQIKEHFKSNLFNLLYDLFVVGMCLGYVFLGSMMIQRMIVYLSHTQFIVLAYALSYLHKTRRQEISQLLKYSIVVLYIFVSYSSFIFHCKDNTGAYVSYFQKDMHATKDNLRAIMIEKQKQ